MGFADSVNDLDGPYQLYRFKERPKSPADERKAHILKQRQKNMLALLAQGSLPTAK